MHHKQAGSGSNIRMTKSYPTTTPMSQKNLELTLMKPLSTTAWLLKLMTFGQRLAVTLANPFTDIKINSASRDDNDDEDYHELVEDTTNC